MDSLKGFKTLKQHSQFSFIYRRGKKKGSNSLVAFFIKSEENRVGFTATKKIGNAVIRNKVKRVLRAIFIETAPRLKNGTYIFVANKKIVDNDYNTIKKDFIYSLKKLELLD